MCNNSLFDLLLFYNSRWHNAPKIYRGLSKIPKTRIALLCSAVVGEHFARSEVLAVRLDGARRRENVGMSNRKVDEKSTPRKPKVSVAMTINHGLGGPKAMAKAVAEWTAG